MIVQLTMLINDVCSSMMSIVYRGWGKAHSFEASLFISLAPCQYFHHFALNFSCFSFCKLTNSLNLSVLGFFWPFDIFHDSQWDEWPLPQYLLWFSLCVEIFLYLIMTLIGFSTHCKPLQHSYYSIAVKTTKLQQTMNKKWKWKWKMKMKKKSWRYNVHCLIYMLA